MAFYRSDLWRPAGLGECEVPMPVGFRPEPSVLSGGSSDIGLISGFNLELRFCLRFDADVAMAIADIIFG